MKEISRHMDTYVCNFVITAILESLVYADKHSVDKVSAQGIQACLELINPGCNRLWNRRIFVDPQTLNSSCHS